MVQNEMENRKIDILSQYFANKYYTISLHFVPTFCLFLFAGRQLQPVFWLFFWTKYTELYNNHKIVKYCFDDWKNLNAYIHAADVEHFVSESQILFFIHLSVDSMNGS